MKIANIVCAWPPYVGGMAGSAQQISGILRRQHDVTDFTPSHLRPWIRHGHGAFLPQLLWHLRKFDCIYLHYPFFGAAEIVWLFKILSPRTKLVIHYHMDAAGLSPIARLLSLPGRLIAKRLFQQAEIIITASLDYVRHSRFKNYYLKHPDKFREIPFGLDLDIFKPALLRWLAANALVAKAQDLIKFVNTKFIKHGRRQLLFVGGLDQAHYFKGLPVLFDALSEIELDKWRLDVVGDGSRRPEYEALAGKLHISPAVSFRGRLDSKELVRAYQSADIFILPSINGHEAFGIVLIEALACGVPVIASDLPGVRSVFNNFQEGLLTTPGDATDLRRKLAALLNDETNRQKMSLAARELAENRYSLARMEDSLLSLFV